MLQANPRYRKHLAMKADDLRALQHAVPFQAFSLALADGRSFDVPHPDFISVAPKGTAVALWDKDGNIGGYLDSALIAEVRIAQAGRTPRRRKPRS
jgi:hypothetical protein